MQYLSRAYQYYSGINPATLTGAIDVIVVKRTDENGEVLYSSSPFHVRFGKLQVLRAGEKKVTLHLPNNLPEPHQAPFWMKVGEAGEAFFVVETEDEVPEELQTSPVISAADAETTLPAPPTDEEFANGHPEPDNDIGEEILTQEPFGGKDGKIEKGQKIVKLDDAHLDPTFLDLNAVTNGQKGDNATTQDQEQEPQESSSHSSSLSSAPAAIINTASALLPSFLHPGSSSKDEEKDEGKSKTPTPRPVELPPNPLARSSESPERKHHAETMEHYVRDHKRRASKRLSTSSAGGADSELPKVKQGEGEPPSIIYKDDLVLDMAGYHQATRDSSEERPSTSQGLGGERETGRTRPITHFEDEQFDPTRQILEMTAGGGKKGKARLIAFAQDLLASAGSSASNLAGDWTTSGPSEAKADVNASSSQQAVIQEIERRFGQLDLTDHASKRPRPTLLIEEDRRRGASEPPPEASDVGTANGDRPPPTYAPSDYTWEWGGFPMKTPLPREQPFFEEEPRQDDESAQHTDVLALRHPSGTTGPERRSSEPLVGEHTVSLNEDGEESARPGMARLATEPAKGSNGHPSGYMNALAQPLGRPGRLKNVEEDPYKFVLEMGHATHTFEMSIGDATFEGADSGQRSGTRVTFQRFIEDNKLVESPDLVLHFESFDLTWQNAAPVLASLIIYRKSLLPPASMPQSSQIMPSLSDIGVAAGDVPAASTKGYGWSRWWRRTPVSASSAMPSPKVAPTLVVPASTAPQTTTSTGTTTPQVAGDLSTQPKEDSQKVYYAKTLRLTSDQLKQLNLNDGANTITFSVTSSYSGQASCTARIFLWDESDQVVISDIDGTITKSDALGHVFTAIGRDWTHLGVAKLYTDITNNGYKIMYLTSRAIGQADSTRDYLKGIHQGNYQLPDGPVIMSPDRLMASLHREVIMRKPELFKMACLRDIQRLFGRNAFYAGFGNRITDAMSYRSVNVPSSRIFTIDSGGEVKMELLELAGYKSSYIHMTDLVDQMFPPIHRKFAPEFTDFNYWREAIPDIPIPDLSPPSPALSARSDGSGRLSVLRNLTTGIGRRSSKQSVASSPAIQPTKLATDFSSRPSSPLVGPALTAGPDTDILSEDEDFWDDRRTRQGSSMPGSLPGSFDDRADYLGDDLFDRKHERSRGDYDHPNEEQYEAAGTPDVAMDQQPDEDDDELGMFEEDLEQMSKVPF